MKNLILILIAFTIVGCGGDVYVSTDKQDWEIDAEICEAQDGYYEQEYSYETGEIITTCHTSKRVCYALCKSYAEICPEVPCE